MPIDPSQQLPPEQREANANHANSVWDGLGYIVGRNFKNDLSESWGEMGRGIRDGVNSFGNAISNAWNGVRDTVGGWFGGGEDDYLFLHFKGGTKKPIDPPNGPASRSPIESAEELQRLADANGIPITELNRLFATDVQIGLKLDGERIISVTGEGTQLNKTKMNGSYNHEIHEYVGQTSGITNVKDLNGKEIKAVNGHFYVYDGTSWRDVTDLQFVAPDGKELTVGEYLGGEGSKLFAPETTGWNINGRKSESTEEWNGNYKPWNPLVNEKYKLYQETILNEIRSEIYDRATGLPKANPDFIFNTSHGGAFNSEYPVVITWNRTKERSWIRIESYYLRANPPKPINQVEFGITGGR
ncbi:hypothetical protein LPTSP4_35670 [Leptospira ryugenii]|uniref:Uncharacterized protein n=1 Tax=Leptospira ryugenii TaxID=1917863 RepID=A0A2P2E575_9LEPT|nr:hypothetical protein [Leptospira ryugenii]GBF52029.1 hypothetical protein LPTSP4_35670 [Leptospira ryugenii]